MNIPNIKDLVLGDKKVYFAHYQDNKLWYRCENGFLFPVPIEDTGSGIFLPEDKASYFMRWINAHVKYISEEYIRNTNEP